MAASSERIRAVVIANLKASPVKSAVLLVGVAVLLFLIVRQFSGGDNAAAGVPVAGSPTVTTAAAPAGNALRKLLPRPAVARTLARDLFAIEWLGAPDAVETATDAAAEAAAPLVLQCTMTGVGNTRSIAVISGMVVEQGAQLAGYEVKEIGIRHAVLRRGANEITLKLP